MGVRFPWVWAYNTRSSNRLLGRTAIRQGCHDAIYNPRWGYLSRTSAIFPIYTLKKAQLRARLARIRWSSMSHTLQALIQRIQVGRTLMTLQRPRYLQPRTGDGPKCRRMGMDEWRRLSRWTRSWVEVTLSKAFHPKDNKKAYTMRCGLKKQSRSPKRTHRTIKDPSTGRKKSSYFRVRIESNQILHAKAADTSKVSCVLIGLCSGRVLADYILDTVPIAYNPVRHGFRRPVSRTRTCTCTHGSRLTNIDRILDKQHKENNSEIGELGERTWPP